MLRPLYRRIADLDNAAIFSATTLLVVLGTSVVTQFAGLSLALGAFLVCLSQLRQAANFQPIKPIIYQTYCRTGERERIGAISADYKDLPSSLADMSIHFIQSSLAFLQLRTSEHY